MATAVLDETISVTLDGSGNGTVKLGPKGAGTIWNPDSASVSCQPSPPVNEAQCKIYVGDSATQSNFRDGTFSGSSGDATDKVSGIIRQGSYIFAVWSGGDPGASATLNIAGSKTIP